MSSTELNKSERRPGPDWSPAPVRADPLRRQVFDILRHAIFAGNIRPGEILRELQLARNLGVSQSTAREALGQLEHVGLVVRQPNRSTTVTNLGAKEVSDRLKMRLALEELAFAEAATTITEQDLAELENIARSIAGSIAAGSFCEMGQADLAFHRRIWLVSGNSVLYQTLNAITTPLFAFLGVLQKMASISPQSTQPHEALIAALRTCDPDRAREAIRGHILLSYGSIMEAQPKTVERSLPRATNLYSRGKAIEESPA